MNGTENPALTQDAGFEHMPKHIQVRVTLESEMRAGKWTDGAYLPSETRLARMFDVGRTTLRQALADLRKDGLVESTRGRRSVIRNRFLHERALKIVWLGGAAFSELEPVLMMVYQQLIQLPEAQRHNIAYWFMRDAEDEQWLLRNLEDIDGLIVSDVEVARLEPAVTARIRGDHRMITLLPTNAHTVASTVITDNRAGGSMAAEYLMKQGCRKFLILGITPGLRRMPFHERITGFTERLLDGGRVADFRVVTSEQEADFSDVGSALERRGIDPGEFDAIYSVTDDVAVKVIALLRQRNIRVPEEIAVMGFDGRPGEEFLTTLGTDALGIAQRIFTIIDGGRSRKHAGGVWRIKPCLIERQSALKKAP